LLISANGFWPTRMITPKIPRKDPTILFLLKGSEARNAKITNEAIGVKELIIEARPTEI